EKTLADEALVELIALAFDAAEMDVDDLVLRTEVPDAAHDVLVAAHLRPAADAEEEPPRRTVPGDLARALEAVEAGEDARDAADRFAGRVVRVQREPHAGL